MALVKKYIEYKDVQLSKVPAEIKSKIKEAHKIVNSAIENQLDQNKLKNDKDVMDAVKEFRKQIAADEKSVRVYKVKEDKFECMVQLINHVKNDLKTEKGKKLNKLMQDSFKQAKEVIEKQFKMTLDNEGSDKEGFEGFDVYPDGTDAKQIWDSLKEGKNHDHTKSEKSKAEVKTEATNQFEVMSIMKVLQSINNSVIDNVKISDSDTKLISTEVTKKMLPKSVGRGFKDFKVVVDNSITGSAFEFQSEKIQDSDIDGLLEGKENLYKLLTANKEISIRGTSKFFQDSKGTNDFYYFCDNAIKFYGKTFKKICSMIQNELVHLDSKMKNLIKGTDLKKIVAALVQQCLSFREARISSHGTFTEKEKEIKKLISEYMFKTLKSFKDPEASKDEILKTFDLMIKSFKESYKSELKSDLLVFIESLQKLYNGEYKAELREAEQLFINECINWETPARYETKVLLEKFGVKRLKKIPSDLLPYIRMQIDRIEDENDKYMLAGYTQSKIEIVEWYIELLTVGSDRYIVPHTLPQLQRILQELNFCYKKIVSIRVSGGSGSGASSYGNIKYPSGYSY